MPCCPANVRETKIAFGFKPQTNVATPNVLADLWSLTKTNPSMSVVSPVTENDAADIGKGDEFPANIFPSHIDTSVAVEKFVSSEFMAWLFCFTTGKATKTTVAGPPASYTYAATPSDPVVSCINLPAFTWAEQIRTPAASAVVDRALVGMVVNDWTMTMESGPGRANCRVSANFVGSGRTVAPASLAPTTYNPFPAVTAEHFLNAASATITINGINYVTEQSFISLNFSWNNNVRLDTGLYPGSGVQVFGTAPNDKSYAVRGRMEYGNRECSLTFVARACAGTQELLNLLSLTEGATTITLQGAQILGAAYHGLTISLPRTVISACVNGEADGIVTVECTVTALKAAGATPYATLTAVTTKDLIMALALEQEEPLAA